MVHRLLLVLVAGSTALSSALQPSTTYRIVVVAPVPSGLTASLERAAKPFEAILCEQSRAPFTERPAQDAVRF